MISSALQFVAKVEECAISYFNDWAPFGSDTAIEFRRIVLFKNDVATLQVWKKGTNDSPETFLGQIVSKSINTSTEDKIYESTIFWAQTNDTKNYLSILASKACNDKKPEEIFKNFKNCWESTMGPVEKRDKNSSEVMKAPENQDDIDSIIQQSSTTESPNLDPIEG